MRIWRPRSFRKRVNNWTTIAEGLDNGRHDPSGRLKARRYRRATLDKTFLRERYRFTRTNDDVIEQTQVEDFERRLDAGRDELVRL